MKKELIFKLAKNGEVETKNYKYQLNVDYYRGNLCWTIYRSPVNCFGSGDWRFYERIMEEDIKEIEMEMRYA